jgi:ApaG protein
MSKTTAITKGVLVSVEVTYQPEHSDPRIPRFVFSYLITIENQTKTAIQLLRRNWTIFESNGTKRNVEGAGVVGEQPVIESGETFEYTSWCPIQNKMGYMQGTYLVKDEMSGELFDIEIPRFQLVLPDQLN